MVLFGGVTNDKILSRVQRRYISYSDLWYLRLNDPVPDFRMIEWGTQQGSGFSRVVALGGEIVCLLKSKLKDQMTVLDMEQLVVYQVDNDNPEDPSPGRDVFGAISINNTIVIVGGYTDTYGTYKIAKGPIIFAIRIDLITKSSVVAFNGATEQNYALYAITLVPLAIGIFIYLKYRKLKAKSIHEKEKKAPTLKHDLISTAKNSQLHAPKYTAEQLTITTKYNPPEIKSSLLIRVFRSIIFHNFTCSTISKFRNYSFELKIIPRHFRKAKNRQWFNYHR
jgi:hypothetical protein